MLSRQRTIVIVIVAYLNSFNHFELIQPVWILKVVIVIVVSDLLISYFESFVDYLVITMPRESTTRSKKRKFRGNRYGNARKTCVVEEEHYTDAGPSASDETAGTLSASARKIGFQNTERCSTSEEGINCNVTGYRLIDME